MARVLIVDDEPTIRISLREYLKEDGHEVAIAEDAAAALDHLGKNEFDVAVIDIHMPRMNGIELLERIHKSAPRIQAVMITGEPNLKSASEVVRLGAFDYLTKPTGRDVVRRVVAKAAEMKQVLDEKTQLEQQNRKYHEELEELVEERTTALRKSEEKFRHIFESAADGIIYADRKGIIIDANPELCRISNTPRSELVGKSASTLARKMLKGRSLARIMKIIPSTFLGKKLPPFRIEFGDKTLEISPTFDIETQRATGIIREVTDQKQALAVLRESEERYRRLFELSPEGIITMGLTGYVTSCNQSFERLTGFSRNEIVGVHFSKLPTLYKRDIVTFTGMLKDIMRGRLSQNLEFRWKNKQGELRYGEANIGFIEEHGRKAGLQIVLTDITERMRTGAALRESEERYRSVHQKAPIAFCVWEPDATLIEWNDEAEKIFGFTKQEAIGRSFFDLIIPNSAVERVEKVIDRIIRGDIPDCVIDQNVTRDGALIWCQWNNAVVTDDSGEVRYIISMGMDITDQQTSQEALRKSEERFRMVSDLTSDSAYSFKVEADGNLVNEWVIGAFRDMTGYTAEELHELGGWSKLIHPEDMEIPLGQMEAMLAGLSNSVEYRIVTKSGETRWVNDTARSVMGEESGKPERIVGAINDITERMQIEVRLRQSQKLESVGTLAGGVAHEINNPLMGMINYADLIEYKADDATLKGYAHAIQEEGQRVATIVRNLLQFSRQDSKVHSYALMVDIVKATLSLTTANLRKSQVIVELDIPKDLPAVKCRSQQIQQVLLNLMNNAHHALDKRYSGEHEDKLLRISARAFEQDGEDWVRTTVEDHGFGIPADNIDRIFDPFFTTKHRTEGAGLGLSVSYGIVSDHHGMLTVESSEGEYTRFLMDLPVNPVLAEELKQE